ncbi:hypothetical protein GCM10007140_23340 [Priestia taiwanensis]|uniref:Uncharacterized protein n=1 Tax=Priestia taiwanensis TaxID=1347902 RepID=A0A917AU41_9BACI|nr:hypothetical protein GCM10007140_23340 [Priestia taiwanensis]
MKGDEGSLEYTTSRNEDEWITKQIPCDHTDNGRRGLVLYEKNCVLTLLGSSLHTC